jgi:hypothetical protein
MLFSLKVRSIQLMTNNPRKIENLTQYGITVNGRIPVIIPPNPYIVSSIGAIILQGVHQGAQKSTMTGRSDCRTAFSNSASFTATGFDILNSFVNF